VTELSSQETSERVLDALRKYARGHLVSASVRDLATELSIGRATVNRAIHRLVEEGKVTVARQGTGHLYPTTYLISQEVS
jgi:DNA-binding transcriptional regulator YhcF (GntR family)